MKTPASYRTTIAMAAALAVIFLVPVGCGPREAAAPAPSSTEPMAATAPAAESPAPAAESSAPAAEPPAATPPASTAPAPSADGVVDPGGEIAVEPTRPGLTRVGATKCGVCHKLQYASWSETAHAKRTPPLDCESCHGPGSEYKSLSVMKDPEKAKAAGLVLPTATFCQTCHRQGWSDELLHKVHAHKNPPKS